MNIQRGEGGGGGEMKTYYSAYYFYVYSLSYNPLTLTTSYSDKHILITINNTTNVVTQVK